MLALSECIDIRSVLNAIISTHIHQLDQRSQSSILLSYLDQYGVKPHQHLLHHKVASIQLVALYQYQVLQFV